MSMIPAQILIGVTWQSNPPFVEQLRQPAKGIALLSATLALGGAAAAVDLFVVGGGITPPGLPLISYTVLALVVMLSFALMFGGWPFMLPERRSVMRGMLMLVVCYIVSYGLFYFFFDFSFLRDAIGQSTGALPHGLFNANTAIVFAVTFSSGLSLLLHFDLWPLTAISILRRQPWLGLAWTVIALMFGCICMYLGVSVFRLTPLSFLARVPVPFVLGSIILLNAMEDSLFKEIRQPLRGICNASTATALGAGLVVVYEAVAHLIVGKSGANGQPDGNDALWMATAMLVTLLPLLVLVDFFRLWPFSYKRGT